MNVIHVIQDIDATQIPNAQIKFGAEHSKFCASQIIYGIYGIPNYYDIPKLGFPLTFEIFPIIYQIISKGVNMCNI